MVDESSIQRVKANCVLIQIQLARVGETYNAEENCKRAVERGKIKQEDADFILAFLKMHDDWEKTGEIDIDAALAAIPRIQMIAASNLNCGDSA